MPQGYQVEQALGFITEYMSEYNVTTREFGTTREPSMVDELLEGKGKPKILSEELRSAMHAFVLDNSVHIEPFRQ